MAIVLQTGKTFNPAISASYGRDMTGTGYYGVIDDVRYNKASKICYFSVDIYGSQTSREEDGTVVDRVVFSYHDADFDAEIGNSGLTIPQAYTKALATLTDWESDE